MYKPLEIGYIPLALRLAVADAAMAYANALADPCARGRAVNQLHDTLEDAAAAVRKVLAPGRD